MQDRTFLAKGSISRRGQGKVTIVDVAREAKVSPMTVSRVINGEGNVRQSTLERVQRAIEKLGYAPNEAARSLAGAAGLHIGLLYDNPSSAYLAELLLGVLDQASGIGAQLAVQKSDGPGQEEAAVARLLAARVDGVILPPPLSENDRLLAMLRGDDIPVVCLATRSAPDDGLSVRIDDFDAARSMTRHLIALGHRAIGFVKGHPNQTASEDRFRGYLAALEEAGIAPDEGLVRQGYFTYQSGLEAAEAIIAQRPRPTAIFASNDDMAAAAAAIAHKHGLDVPGDITVVGYDDTQLAVTVYPELTTIRQPIAEMARHSVDLLSKAVREKRKGQVVTPAHLIEPYALIERDSAAGIAA